MRMKFLLLPAFALLAATCVLAAEKEHATLVRSATLYVLPGGNSEKLVKVERGRDLVILEKTNVDNQGWLKVYATLIEIESQREISGWLPPKGVVSTSMPNA